MENLDFEKISFGIIAFAGEAKGHAMQSIKLAKQNKFDEAFAELEEADNKMINAEKTHMDVIVAEAKGEKNQLPALFVHAEDQLMTTQMLIIIAKEFVDLYKKINKDKGEN